MITAANITDEQIRDLREVRVTNTEFRALKNAGQMTDIGDASCEFTPDGQSPNYPIWDNRTCEWVNVVVEG